MRISIAMTGLALAVIPAAAQPAPTATEIFELRTKCQAMAEKLLTERKAELYGLRGLYIEVKSNLNLTDVRCYAKLEVSYNHVFTNSTISENDNRRDKFVYLYDMNTRELLAGTTEIEDKHGYIFDDYFKEKSSMLFKPPTEKYEITTNIINKIMDAKREY